MTRVRMLLRAIRVLVVVTLGAVSLLQFGDSYHLDFSAYWSAVRVASAGGDPYYDFPVSNGQAFAHTFFLYPPASLGILWPFASMPYHTARIVWLALQPLLLIAILKAAGLRWRASIEAAAVLLAVAPWAVFPLHALLERGQADMVTLAFIAWSWHAWSAGASYRAGGLLAGAAVLKPPVLFLLIVPFLSADRRFIAGCALGFAAFSVLSFPIAPPALHARYWFDLAPVIARTGFLPDSDHIVATASDTPSWEGHSYVEPREFEAGNGTLVRVIEGWFPETDGTYWSLVALGAIALAIAGLAPWRSGAAAVDRRWAWSIGMMAVLICHPLTWVMNYVWVVLPGAWVWQGLRTGAGMRPGPASLALVLLGAVLVGVGDGVLPPSMPEAMVDQRVIMGGVVILSGLLVGAYGARSRARRTASTDPQPPRFASARA